jgi:hypothetical protein
LAGGRRHSARRPRSVRLWLDPLEDRSLPSLVGTPSAIVTGDVASPQFHVYAIGDDGALKEDVFDGTSWTWSDLGTPSGVALDGTPSAVVDDRRASACSSGGRTGP